MDSPLYHRSSDDEPSPLRGSPARKGSMKAFPQPKPNLNMTVEDYNSQSDQEDSELLAKNLKEARRRHVQMKQMLNKIELEVAQSMKDLHQHRKASKYAEVPAEAFVATLDRPRASMPDYMPEPLREEAKMS